MDSMVTKKYSAMLKNVVSVFLIEKKIESGAYQVSSKHLAELINKGALSKGLSPIFSTKAITQELMKRFIFKRIDTGLVFFINKSEGEIV